MKKIFFLFLIINLTSCSFLNREKIEVEIYNKSSSTITDILFDTNNDSLKVKKLGINQKLSKTIKYKIYEDYGGSWGISFLGVKGELKRLACTDILDSSEKRILKITVLDNKIETDFNGECY